MRERLVPPGYVDRLFRLDDQVALVTGGASGLGAAIAAGLGQAGARVVLADLDLAGAREYAAILTDLAHPPVALEVDVARRDSVDALVGQVVRRLGRIDVLVQSAGTTARYPAEDFPDEVWDRIVAVNLKGSFLVAQAVGRQMLRQGAGSIINITPPSARPSPTPTLRHTSSRRVAWPSSRGAWRSSGSTGESGSTRSPRRSSTPPSRARPRPGRA
jgi:NAD(P)-dependent dehydrogenase (short-subunit alcohol dehydrogenase family)